MENINQLKMDIEQKPLSAGATNCILHDGKWDLIALRNSHGLSTAKVAALVGVTPATVWHWEQKPASELSPKNLKQLATVFSENEIESILNPQDYFDEHGNQIKPILDKEAASAMQQTLESVKLENSDSTVRKNEHDGTDSDFLYNEITTVFNKLSENNKKLLVDYADFLYHQERGMKLPYVTK